MILVNIFYNDNTLFVSIYEELNSYNVNRLKLRVFKIVTEYDIENVVLSINNCKKNSYLLKDFINEYEATFNGHIKVK